MRPVTTGNASGFSLIELLIVITIAALLTALATASYRSYTQRAWRTEAITALTRLRTAEENFRNINNTYTSDLAALGFPGGCSANCIYTIDFTRAPDTRSFVARARPTPGGGRNGVDQGGDRRCQWFTLEAGGRRGAGPAGDCWAR